MSKTTLGVTLLLGGLAALGWLALHDRQTASSSGGADWAPLVSGDVASNAQPATAGVGTDDPLDREDLAFMDSWVGAPLV
jgi:hypothetical protein